ncbi:unnamed protein product [Ilex paraguariensis]|uniref:Uncharacterized protein n=1 Tax=Ilex paraguariensis TaxID=185542 RepID=A0ABC8QZD5_9AQUA
MVASACFVPGIIHHDLVAKNALIKKSLTLLDMLPDYSRAVKRAFTKADSPDCWEIINGRRQVILHIALVDNRKPIVEYILQNSRAISTLITQKGEDDDTPFHFLAASCLTS